MDKKEVDKIVQDARREYERANLSRVGLIDIIAGMQIAEIELEQQLAEEKEKSKKAVKANEVFDVIYDGLKEDIKNHRVALEEAVKIIRGWHKDHGESLKMKPEANERTWKLYMKSPVMEKIVKALDTAKDEAGEDDDGK